MVNTHRIKIYLSSIDVITTDVTSLHNIDFSRQTELFIRYFEPLHDKLPFVCVLPMRGTRWQLFVWHREIPLRSSAQSPEAQ